MREFPTASDEMTMQEYLDEHQVTCTPCEPDAADSVAVSIPQLPGWILVPPALAPGAHTVLVNPAHKAENWFPNAALMHGALSPTVDTDQLLACALTDSRRLRDWRESEWNRFPYQGHPSAFIRGVYTADRWSLSATTRYTVITDSSQQYLTQLTVTTLHDQAGDLDADVNTMNVGLTITVD
ncbi:LpqN/LpqT family lipoprotein [Rhodococcus sp. NPDC049939]|uniref:LpqN/LpqT family lipoprotein n=1 Tax=Rhodococcus sp. NPDC049939 TaxID=3155511 RepID=UPI0033D8C31D